MGGLAIFWDPPTSEFCDFGCWAPPNALSNVGLNMKFAIAPTFKSASGGAQHPKSQNSDVGGAQKFASQPTLN